MKKGLFVCLLVLCITTLFTQSCVTNDRGISPDPSKIHYPLSLAVHPTGKFLYVVNSNFDLSFNGGSINVFPTAEEKTIKTNVNGIITELKTLEPITKATVEIGSFAGGMALNASGTRAYISLRQDLQRGSGKACSSDSDCAATEVCSNSACETKDYVDTSSVLAVKINANELGEKHFDCSQTPIAKENTGGVGIENTFDMDPAPRCADSAKLFLEKVKCEKDEDCVSGQSCKDGVCTGSFVPFSLRLLETCQEKTCTKDSECGPSATCAKGKCQKTCATNGDCGSGYRCESKVCKLDETQSARGCNANQGCEAWQMCSEQRLFVSHLDARGFSSIKLAPTTDKIFSSWDFQGHQNLPGGVTSLALLPAGTKLGGGYEVFLSSRLFRDLYIVPPLHKTWTDEQLQSYDFQHSLLSSTDNNGDFRGMAFVVDKKTKEVRLFVANRIFNSVFVFRVQRTSDGLLSLTTIKSIPVGAEPAHMALRKMPGSSADLLYVVCSRDRRIDVINTVTMHVENHIKVREQPYFISIFQPTKNSALKKPRAYVANFLESTVSIISLVSNQEIGLIQGIDTKLVVNP